jgi:hypoxanthine phosphoribosyltransferase
VSAAPESAPPILPEGVAAVLYSAAEVQAAVRRLADGIAADTQGEAIHLIGVLKGAIFLTADIARALSPNLAVTIDFLGVTSYGRSNRSSGEVRFRTGTSDNIEDKHVVIVEDILDSGRTLEAVGRYVTERRPASVRSCVLLERVAGRAVPVSADYVGFVAPDTFIVGYGLDFQEKYRHLPYLAKLHAWVFS